MELQIFQQAGIRTNMHMFICSVGRWDKNIIKEDLGNRRTMVNQGRHGCLCFAFCLSCRCELAQRLVQW